MQAQALAYWQTGNIPCDAPPAGSCPAGEGWRIARRDRTGLKYCEAHFFALHPAGCMVFYFDRQPVKKPRLAA